MEKAKKSHSRNLRKTTHYFNYLLNTYWVLLIVLYTKKSGTYCLWCFSHSVESDPLQPYGLEPAQLLCPWGSPGKNTGGGCHFLLQGLFPTQGSNPVLPGQESDTIEQLNWTEPEKQKIHFLPFTPGPLHMLFWSVYSKGNQGPGCRVFFFNTQNVDFSIYEY